jgi:hypothetical protein
MRWLSREHGKPRSRLYVDDPQLVAVIAVFGAPRPALRRLAEATEFDHDRG